MTYAFLAQAGASGGGGGFLGFLPFILIMVIIYMLMIRPQMKKQKQQTAMLSSLSKNDEVVTSGGVHGRIVHINEKDATLQILVAKGIVLTIERSSIARLSEGKGGPPPRQISSGDDQTRKKQNKRPDHREQKREPAAATSGAEPQPPPSENKTEAAVRGVVTSSPSGSEMRRTQPKRGRPRRASMRSSYGRDRDKSKTEATSE